MSRVLKITNPQGIYFVTFTVIHWIDLFTRPEYCDILLNSLRHCQENKGLVIHAFVIMSSHMQAFSKKLLALAGDDRKLAEMGRQSLAQAARFSWEEGAKAFLNILKNKSSL